MSPRDAMRAIEILLVEDSPTDRLIAVEALERSLMLNSVNVVENGVDALSYLRREGPFAEARRPDLILLDLNLPKKDGREVLAEIKADPALKLIPVIVLTTSEAEENLLEPDGSRVSYITKPVDFGRFTEALAALGGYGVEVVTLPTETTLERIARQSPVAALPTHPLDGVLRLLLIEDNPTDVLLFRDAIDSNGLVSFELTHVARLADAREQLRACSFDLVVTDLSLPDSQGLETFRQVRAWASNLPTIVLTGLDDEAVGISAMREGAQDYLIKGQLTGRAVARAARYAIDKRQHQEQLRQAQRLEAVGRLAAGAAHDFNNVLAVIRGNAELLPGTTDAQELAESAKEIQEAADRATRIARQLLAFSKPQAVEPRVVDLNRVVGQFTKMMRRLLGEGIHLELRLGAEVPAILADVGMLEQVLLNLAVNARDAMPGGGKVSVRTSAVELDARLASSMPNAHGGRFARLSVTDSGAGMTEDVRERIFEPFFTTKPSGMGTGLGLATVHSIVTQHRGSVEVVSRVGVGTTFEIFLPSTTVAPESTGAAPDAEVTGGRETVLVVEDEGVLRQLAARMLSRAGYRVLEAPSVEVALSLWKAHRGTIDLLLMDLMLPDDGSARRLRKELADARPALPVIFTSGFYRAELADEGFTLEEGRNFLRKPYELKHLLQIVRRRLDGPRQPSRLTLDYY